MKTKSIRKQGKANPKKPVSHIQQIKVLLKAIEDMKDKIIEVWSDKTLSVAEKNAKIEAMGDALHATEKYTLHFMAVVLGGKNANVA